MPVALVGNADKITAGQFVLNLPEGISLNAVTTDLCHTTAVQRQEDGTYRIVCLSLDNSTFTGSRDAIVTLHLQSNTDAIGGDVCVSDIELATPSLTTTHPKAAKAFISIGTTGIGNLLNGNGNSAVYDITGRKVNNVTSGVYIKDGKKLIVK